MNRAYHEATITVLASILAEEAFLTARFGQTSLDSCQRVRRFLPTVTGLRDSLLYAEYTKFWLLSATGS
jgi:hypothetical protein